jgi:tetratricopeptide (TPR) repeat protein
VKALSETEVSGESRPQAVTDVAEAAAKQILNKKLEELSRTEEIAAWAKAQLLNKNYPAALEGYEKAILQSPNDVKLRVERAVAASHAGQPRNLVKEQLLDAYQRLTPQTPPEVKTSLYKELTYCCLYLPPPGGFTLAIQFAEEYLNDSANPKSGFIVAKIYTNLAAAYGQEYEWYKLHPDPTVDLKVLRDKALDAIKKALAIDASVREQLKMLMDPHYPNKDPEEDDLEVFVNDPEFRQVAGMSGVSRGPDDDVF